jgi:CPA1 family monovalent cation:H+ antiporter
VTILEGGSLVNDASGLLLYRIAVAAVATGTFRAWSATGTFFVLALGRIAFGFTVGKLTSWIITKRQATHEVVMISFLASWATYIIADRIGTLGVLAVVTSGLVVGWKQHEILTARSRTASRAVWQFTVSVFESLVFVLIGLSLRDVLTRLGGIDTALAAAGPLTLIVVATVIGARLLWVFPAMYLVRCSGGARRQFDG